MTYWRKLLVVDIPTIAHGSVTTTLAVYTPSLNEMHEAAVGRLNELLFGPERGDPPVTFLSDRQLGKGRDDTGNGKPPRVRGFSGRARQDSNLRPPDS